MIDPTKGALLTELAQQESLLKDLERQRDEGLARVEGLRRRLAATELVPLHPVPELRASKAPPAPFTTGDKLRLFRKLFHGREDLFPRYWENLKKGAKGYSPVCSNEWVSGICNKPRVKCGECPNRAFIPVSDKAILDHFNGRHIIGVYPMLEDETCWFLAADFDKTSWKEDVAAFVETCRAAGVHPSVERSRSGNGAHVWFFFATPVAANVARRMGCFLITETMARRHQLGMESYDRLFPNQDTMPRGGFGNLIALPFQDKARKKGNTLFVDDALRPWPDQWGHLAGVPRLTPDFVEGIAREASRKGLVVGVRTTEVPDEEDAAPWTRLPSGQPRTPRITGPLPAELKVVLAQRLHARRPRGGAPY